MTTLVRKKILVVSQDSILKLIILFYVKNPSEVHLFLMVLLSSIAHKTSRVIVLGIVFGELLYTSLYIKLDHYEYFFLKAWNLWTYQIIIDKGDTYL